MSNKKLYKETFDKITMSEEAFERIRSLEGENKKNRENYFKYAGIVVAAMAAIFISSNTISYAGTGEPLVDMKEYVEKISIFINGKKADESDVKRYVDENGTEHIEMQVAEGDQKGEVHITTDMDSLEKNNLSVETNIDEKGNTNIEISDFPWKVEKKEGKVYLNVKDGKKILDITKDIEDGKAEGKVQVDGKLYKYCVEDFGEEQSIEVKVIE